MATSAQYTAKPAIQANTMILGNANVNGAGQTYVIAQGDLNYATPQDGKGYRIQTVFVRTANATVSGGSLQFYLTYDAGTTLYPITGVVVPVINPGANTLPWEVTVPACEGIILPAGNSSATAQLRASTYYANTFYVTAVGGYL